MEEEKMADENEEKVSKGVKEKENKQLWWILVFIALIFGVFFVIYYSAESLNKFEFVSLNWEKIDQNGLTFYHTNFISNGRTFSLNLRNDPRKNNIPVSVEEFKFYPKTIASLSPGAGNCPGASLPQLELGKFLGSLGLIVDGAVNDEETAKALGVDFITCEDAVNQTVIIIQKSDEPSIERSKVYDTCYIINVGECENIKAIERFMLGVIAQSEFK